MFALATQPQSIGKTLDSGFKLFFAGFKKVFFLALLAALISYLPQMLMGPLVSATEPEAGSIGVLIAVMLGAMILSMVFNTAVVSRLSITGFGTGSGKGASDDTFGRSISIGFKYLLPILFASILYGLAVMGGMVLLIIPGLFLMVSMYLFMPIIVVEGKGPIEALKRSFNLVRGNWWRTCMVLFVAIIIVMVGYVAFGAVIAAAVATFASALNQSATQSLATLLIVVFNAFLIPLIYAMMVALYHDLKLRKDGGDLDSRLARP